MSGEQANDVRDTHGEERDVAGLVTGEPRVICPKCQTQNAPDRVSCSQCRAKLLPGRGALERIGYLIGGVVLAAVFVGLAWLFLQMELAESLPPCCASPLTLILLALSGLVGGVRMAFSHTPEYEKYEKRAQRHAEAAPEQALADFAKVFIFLVVPLLRLYGHKQVRQCLHQSRSKAYIRRLRQLVEPQRQVAGAS